MINKNKGITLVALVITIIILLILAGISIAGLTGNGLFENAKLAKEKTIKEEMIETLILSLQELQVEKKGKATIEDITQDWIDSKLVEYKNTVTEDEEENSKTIIMEKNGIKARYKLDEKMGITKMPDISGNFKIEVADSIISTDTSATESDEPGKLKKGTASYINFALTSDVKGVTYTVTPELPYKVFGNGTYTFTVTGTYEGQTKTEEVKIKVNQYVAPAGLVEYDAGDWTQEEIAELQEKSLYDININKTSNKIFRLKDPTGLNFTFGGFTYRGDTTNSEAIDNGKILTSRNQSTSTSKANNKYDGWQILTQTTKKDESGNTIKNEDGTDRIYVTKLVHAGSPENFAYLNSTSNDGRRAEYLLSNGTRQTGYSKLSDGTAINTRNWDIYKDKELDEKGYIQEVHVMTKDEYKSGTSIGILCWLATASGSSAGWVDMQRVNESGGTSSAGGSCAGVRPVIVMTDGVYIASGEGTAASPYVLGKEE